MHIDRLDLRQTAQPAGKIVEIGAGVQHLTQIFRRARPASLDPFHQRLLQQIDGIERPLGMIGQQCGARIQIPPHRIQGAVTQVEAEQQDQHRNERARQHQPTNHPLRTAHLSGRIIQGFLCIDRNRHADNARTVPH